MVFVIKKLEVNGMYNNLLILRLANTYAHQYEHITL